MYADVQLRVTELGDMLPKYEWQVVRLEVGCLDWIVFSSESRIYCVDWLADHANDIHDYKLQRVRVNVRSSLSPHAKAAMSLIVAKHGREAKINCIKEVRAVYGLGLKEAKELVEDYLDTL